MSNRTRLSSIALVTVTVIGILLSSSFPTVAGEKGAKLAPSVGKIELKDGKGELKGKLADTDPKDVRRTESYCKIYTVKLKAGATYQIDCMSGWDNWLRLEDSKGKQLDENDDGPNGTDAQIIFECKTEGEYRVIVNSFDPGDTGDFTVTIAKTGEKLEKKGEKGEKGAKLGKIEMKDGKGEVKGALADTDPKDARRTESYCKIYTVKLEAGTTYQIDCMSAWDNWLRLEDSKGKQLAENDDGPNGTDAQIIFECKTAGEYRVIVNSFDPGDTGDFTVTVAKQ